MGSIYINYGTDLVAMTMELLERAGIASRLSPGMKVVLKPNLVVARPASEGATTHPEIAEGVIRFLQDCGVGDITIAEGSWVGASTKQAFPACGYADLAARYGVTLLDTKSDRAVTVESHGFKLQICESALNADYLINLPVLKAHCQTDITCCLKNLKGCIPDSEKRRYHTMGLHEPIAALAAALRPSLNIVDSICGDLTFEEGGTPVQQDRLLLCEDGLLADSYGAMLLGYRPEEIEYLNFARRWGVGKDGGGFFSEETELVELNADNRPAFSPEADRTAKRLGEMVEADSACSACYGALLFALHKLGRRSLPDKIKIGQGFRGRQCGGVGIGACTAGCERHLEGCPPKAIDIVEFLK